MVFSLLGDTNKQYLNSVDREVFFVRTAVVQVLRARPGILIDFSLRSTLRAAQKPL